MLLCSMFLAFLSFLGLIGSGFQYLMRVCFHKSVSTSRRFFYRKNYAMIKRNTEDGFGADIYAGREEKYKI